jgi:Domain of unknown function (DUF4424)
MRNLSAVTSVAIAGTVLAAAAAFAQTKPAEPNVPQAPSAPVLSSLVVGAMQVGSAPTLVIAGVDINVAGDKIVHSYFLKNTGSTELGLTAVVSLPELRASPDDSETWALAANDPENPIGLAVTAGGAPVATKADVHVYALGIDRLAEIKAEHLPLIPFGPEADKALATLSPEAAERLAALGIISPRDPSQPKTPVKADWSLDVVHMWRQVLPPGKTTPVTVKFAPVKAEYKMAKGDEQDLADMKDEVCLTPQVLRTLQTRLKGAGVWKVTDISLADDPPNHWIDSPRPTVSVLKPKPDAIVAFCGMDEKSASRPTVLGVAPNDDANEIRIVIFEPAAK